LHIPPTIDDALLLETGMDSEFELIFRNVRWEDAWEITEQGSQLLTIEFLSTLSIDNNEVKHRMFNKPFTLSLKDLSLSLGFSNRYIINVKALHEFNKDNFWESITGKKPERKKKYTTEEVQHPTLRFMLKWLAFTFFATEEINTIRQDELCLLYFMIKKRKVSPVKIMLYYWIIVPSMRKCSISFTSWITRTAAGLILLQNATLTYIPYSQNYRL
jgi:hypothetical protein